LAVAFSAMTLLVGSCDP